MKTTFKIQGLHCSSCKAVIEDIAGEFPDVLSASVDVAGGMAMIEHGATFDVVRFGKEIDGLGQYRVVSVETL